MTIATDLYTYLEDNTSNVSFALILAQPDVVPPYVEITETGKERWRLTTGQNSPTFVTEFDIECWHNNTTSAQSLAASILALIENYTGTLNGNTAVDRTRVYNEQTGSDHAAELFYSGFTVQFTHK